MAASPTPRDPFNSGDLGQIKNSLGLLTPDSNHFYPKVLLEIYTNASELAQLLDIQRTQLYNDKISIRKDMHLRKRILDLVIIADLVFPLLGNDRLKTLKWLSTPNMKLFGDTPCEAVLRGEGSGLITWLMQRSGMEPGQTF